MAKTSGAKAALQITAPSRSQFGFEARLKTHGEPAPPALSAIEGSEVEEIHPSPWLPAAEEWVRGKAYTNNIESA